jgi:hypothetical protein
MLPLLTSFSFTKIVDGETMVSKVTLPLPEFSLAKLQGESNDHFLVRVELGMENAVGSYGRAENACIKALPNGGRLNQVFEKAGVAYGPRPKLGTEASMEAAKKRKPDVCVQPVGKRVKVAKKNKVVPTLKGMAVPKAAVAPKGMAAATPKIVAAPPKAVMLKAAAPLKAATTKAAAAKVATLAAPSTIGGAITSKVAATGQKGALRTMKARVLKIKAGMKRPVSAELSLVKTAK